MPGTSSKYQGTEGSGPKEFPSGFQGQANQGGGSDIYEAPAVTTCCRSWRIARDANVPSTTSALLLLSSTLPAPGPCAPRRAPPGSAGWRRAQLSAAQPRSTLSLPCLLSTLHSPDP